MLDKRTASDYAVSTAGRHLASGQSSNPSWKSVRNQKLGIEPGSCGGIWGKAVAEVNMEAGL